MNPEIDIEQIAAQIHQYYCSLAEREGWKNDFSMPYEQLPEFMKEDNRDAARRIGSVLGLAGLILVPRNDEPWDEDQRSEIRAVIEQNLEVLAEGEHDGWVESRLRQGWRPGPEKNIEAREHHLLKPYAKLSNQEQGKDRDSVRNYVDIIADTPFIIAQERS